MTDDETIQAYWVKTEWEGGGSHCAAKPEQVAKITTSTFNMRLCRGCLDALYQITESLLTE